MTTLDSVHAALATVQDPELHRALPELGMVKSVEIVGDIAKLEILLTISGCPMRDRLQRDIETAVTAVEGVNSVDLTFGVMDEEQRANIKKLLRNGRESFISFAQKDSLTRVIGVASGKGGVGCIRTLNSSPHGLDWTTSNSDRSNVYSARIFWSQDRLYGDV